MIARLRFARSAICLGTTAALELFGSEACADDSARALVELKQGYALKQESKCRDAIAHFARSLELDPKPKAALNMADCEARMGDLIAARGHAVMGLALAEKDFDASLLRVAEEQLAALDKRLPTPAIVLLPDAPGTSVVSRDGAPLGVASLGQMPTVETREIPAPRSDSGLGSRKLVALGVGGTGVVSLVVGGISGLVAVWRHEALVAECNLEGGACPPAAQGDLDSFRSLRTASTVFYVVGGLGLVGGAVLWISAPKPSTDSSAMGLVIGPGSAHIGGTF